MRYILSYQQPNRHFLKIEMVVQNVNDDMLKLQLPAWRPGRYELGNFARNVRDWAAFDAEGAPLKHQKITKDQWEVEAEGKDTVHIHYEYYASELNAGSTFLDETQLYVNPINCFLYVLGWENEPCEVQLKVPDNYEIATGASLKKRTIHTVDYHQLVDSPFIASPSIEHDMYVYEGIEFNIWVQGEAEMDTAKLISDFFLFTHEQYMCMGDFPAEDYHFIFQILPYKAYHGVEHANSTVITLGPGVDLMKEELYSKLLGVSSHELFHTWNVKAIRPEGMQSYDYSKENYTTLGYVAEGVTTYYGDLFLLRSTCFSEQHYLQLLSQQVQRHMDNFGRFHYSVAESGWDTWLDGYSKGVPDRKLSIYNDGCLLAFIADVMIRKATGNERSLDDAMELLYIRYKKGNAAYTETDYEAALEVVSGINFKAYFEKLVWGHEGYEKHLQDALEYLGLELQSETCANVHESELGFKMDGVTVTDVYPDSVADETGLAVGDKIITLNGSKVSSESLPALLSQSDIVLQISTRTGERQVAMSVDEDQHYYQQYKVAITANPNEKQQAAYRHWVGRK